MEIHKVSRPAKMSGVRRRPRLQKDARVRRRPRLLRKHNANYKIRQIINQSSLIL